MHTIAREALDLVESLNDDLEERGKLKHYVPFEFASIGWQESVIKFMGIVIWTDQDDSREFIEEINDYEPFRDCILRKSREILQDLNTKMEIEITQSKSQV